MTFIEFITQGGPMILSVGGVGACVWMAIKIVPEERKAAGIEREAARKDYLAALQLSQDKFLTALTHLSDQDHQARHEMANRMGALQMALYSKLQIPME
jgi:hypothetical protein